MGILEFILGFAERVPAARVRACARRGRREHGCTKISEVRQKGHQCPYSYSKLLEKFQIVAAI